MRRRRVSKKHAADLKEYVLVRNDLMRLNYESGAHSELSGKYPTYSPALECVSLENHHITGRRTRRELLSPFNMILLTTEEHRACENNQYSKEELLAIVRPIRIAQGFRPEDYF